MEISKTGPKVTTKRSQLSQKRHNDTKVDIYKSQKDHTMIHNNYRVSRPVVIERDQYNDEET